MYILKETSSTEFYLRNAEIQVVFNGRHYSLKDFFKQSVHNSDIKEVLNAIQYKMKLMHYTNTITDFISEYFIFANVTPDVMIHNGVRGLQYDKDVSSFATFDDVEIRKGMKR